MAVGDVYTTLGENATIDLLDTWFSTTWAFHTGIGTTTPAKGDSGIETSTDLPAKATPASPAKTQPTADKLQFVGTVAYAYSGGWSTGTKAITELGLFGPSATPMFQHHVFAAINVANGDSIEFTVVHEQA